MSHIEIKLVADSAADLSLLIAGLQSQMAANVEPQTKAPAKKDKPPEEEKAVALSAPVETPAATDAPSGADDEPATTYSDVQAATAALAAAKGRDAAVACLAEFNAKNGKELTEAQWAPYVERAREMVEG